MKYMGSKSRLSKELSKIINKIISEEKIENYIEPFVGGANLIEKIECKKKFGYDINVYLIDMFNALKKGYNPPKMISKEEYMEIKNNKDKFPRELVSIAGFCASYNAKWFGGYAGEVNTKVGKVRNYYDESVRNLLKQMELIKDVEFISCDYREIKIENKTLIYCDPPYKGTTEYNISKGFDHDLFWDWVREQSEQNIVIVSEYNAPDDFKCIYEKSLKTTMDNKSSKKDTEKLFVIKGSVILGVDE